MSSTLILFILLFVLICVVLFYFFTQKSLNDISTRLNKIEVPERVLRTPDTIRRERAYSHDQIVILEAQLINEGREDLTEAEMQEIDRARKKIKSCADELRALGDWIGLPFDLEWNDILDRLPVLNRLYRKAIAAQTEALNPPPVAPPEVPAPAPQSRLRR
jgi:hypothetical protein